MGLPSRAIDEIKEICPYHLSHPLKLPCDTALNIRAQKRRGRAHHLDHITAGKEGLQMPGKQ